MCCVSRVVRCGRICVVVQLLSYILPEHLEHAVVGAAKFDNQKLEGEALFKRSSVRHGKHVTGKSNSR